MRTSLPGLGVEAELAIETERCKVLLHRLRHLAEPAEGETARQGGLHHGKEPDEPAGGAADQRLHALRGTLLPPGLQARRDRSVPVDAKRREDRMVRSELRPHRLEAPG